ncbi:helix-turn-helix domain-containing protein [Vibrio brasiliensis]
MSPSKTKTSFYRRVLITYLIDTGINTLPKIQKEIDIPRRTVQDTINALSELDIECIYLGATKNGHYKIESWGPLNKQWVEDRIEDIRETLGY